MAKTTLTKTETTDRSMVRAVERVLLSVEGKAREAFISIIDQGAKSPAVTGILAQIANSSTTTGYIDPYLVEQLLEQLKDTLDIPTLGVYYQEAMVRGAEVSQIQMMSIPGMQQREYQLRSEGVITGPIFDPLDPTFIDIARYEIGERITRISDKTRENLRSIIADGLSRGDHPWVVARHIRQHIGLTPRDAKAVANYERSLLAQGKSPARAAELGQRYSRRLLNARAKTVARTEMMDAVNQGQLELFRQANESGLVAQGDKLKWLAHLDNRTSAICNELHEQEVEVGQPFISSYVGAIMRPPAHPNCRSTLGLNPAPVTLLGSTADYRLEDVPERRFNVRDELVEVVKHMPGKHDQKTHGRGRSGQGKLVDPGPSKSTFQQLSQRERSIEARYGSGVVGQVTRSEAASLDSYDMSVAEQAAARTKARSLINEFAGLGQPQTLTSDHIARAGEADKLINDLSDGELLILREEIERLPLLNRADAYGKGIHSGTASILESRVSDMISARTQDPDSGMAQLLGVQRQLTVLGDAAKRREAFEAAGIDPDKKPTLSDVASLAYDDEIASAALTDAMTMSGTTDAGANWSLEIDQADMSGDTGHVLGHMNVDGVTGGRVELSLYFDEGRAYHDLIVMPQGTRGKGVGTAMTNRLYDMYRGAGIDRVSLQAGLSVGGYAWAKAGYDWDSPPGLSDGFDLIETAWSDGSIDDFTYDELRNDLSYAQDGGMTAFETSQIGIDYADAFGGTWPGREALLGNSWDGTLWL